MNCNNKNKIKCTEHSEVQRFLAVVKTRVRNKLLIAVCWRVVDFREKLPG